MIGPTAAEHRAHQIDGRTTAGVGAASAARRLLSVAALLEILCFLTITFVDADLWGHLTFGRDIVRQGWVHTSDPYSFTSDRPWINHEWLAEAAMWCAYSLRGTMGLIILKLLLVCSAGALMLRSWRSFSLAPGWRDALLFATAVGAWPLVATIRPQVFSMVFFTALLFVLTRSRDDVRWVWALPPLFALWVNVHGGWLVGAGVLGIFAAWAPFDKAFSARGRLALGCACCLAAASTLCNPYGVRMLSFLSETVRPVRMDIVEWQGLASLPRVALVLWCVPASMAVAAVWRSGRSIPVAHLLVTSFVGVAAIYVARLGGFFAIAVGLLLAPYIPGAHPAAAPTDGAGRRSWIVQSLAVLVLVSTAVMLFGRDVTVDGEWSPEPEATEFVKTRGLEGRMLTWFDYGEYAIWQLSPKIRVSMDGRRETVYSDEMRALHQRIYTNQPDALDAVARLAPDYIWLPRRLPVTDRLQTAGWQPLYSGARSTILAFPHHRRSAS